MNQTTCLHIDGMTCTNCQKRIEQALRSKDGVKDARVSYTQGTAQITYDDRIVSVTDLISVIEELDYRVVRAQSRVSTWLRTIALLIIIAALYSLLQSSGILNALAPSQLADSRMGYSMLFVVGLLTSVHCIAMCGGINLSQSLPRSAQGRHNSTSRMAAFLPNLFYNAGRVCSYTLIGFLLGLAGYLMGGADMSVSTTLQGIIKILAGICMVLMGVNMLGLFPPLRELSLHISASIARLAGHHRTTGLSPFFIGLLNGIMPCGPLQAMWIVALATANPFAGALSMLCFSLGTVPLMLGLGSVIAALGRKFTRQVMLIGSVMVVVLGLAMFSQGTSLTGWHISMQHNCAMCNDTSDNAASSVDSVAEIVDGTQVVYSTLSSRAYPAITVQSGVPVRWIIDAPQGSITGCNRRMILSTYDITYTFENGENIIEFTPTETGTYDYTCWMGMVHGSINVTS